MSKPQPKLKIRDIPGQTKTMFITEGDPNAELVIESASGYRKETFWFPHPEYALGWCLKNGANFVYARRAQNN